MAHHPSGHDLTENLERMALINRIVHSVAIATLPMMLLGLMALRRRLGPSNLGDAALVLYAFTAESWLVAAVASGFVQTELFVRMAEAEGGQLARYKNESVVLIG